jgi:transcriptional regulator GlxA family with amidase domain
MDFRIARASGLIRFQFQADLRNEELARSVNLSTRHFCRLFKEETGFTPAQYLKQIRVQKAVELLEASCMSVKEVSAAVGLKHSSHFDHFFKKARGLTPMEYRERRLQESAGRPVTDGRKNQQMS